MDTNEIINNLIDHIVQDNNTDATELVHQLLSTKVNDTLEARKVEVAQNIYNTPSEEEVEDGQEEATEEIAP